LHTISCKLKEAQVTERTCSITSRITTTLLHKMEFDGPSDNKPRLTSEQKKKNHIESEKKRREAIRQGFERLSTIVPGCEGQARSESVVLQKTVKHLREVLEKKDALKLQAEAVGMSEGDFQKV